MILTSWGDLFRTGHLAWGYDLNNPGPPFLHVTESGRKTLEQFSRDPANPAGYIAHLDTQVNLDPISRTYVVEALTTYNSACIKAPAVMIGCATESLILTLRDTLVKKMNQLSKPLPSGLNDWKAGRVLQAIQKELDSQKLPHPLVEEYRSFWSAFSGQIRLVRNDAGHPASLDPVTGDAVHSNLLIFPALAKLAKDLIDWVTTSYV